MLKFDLSGGPRAATERLVRLAQVAVEEGQIQELSVPYFLLGLTERACVQIFAEEFEVSGRRVVIGTKTRAERWVDLV